MIEAQHLGQRTRFLPSAHAASSVKTWRTKSSLEFPQPHVVYANGTNRWSLNTGTVIELLCGY